MAQKARILLQTIITKYPDLAQKKTSSVSHLAAWLSWWLTE